MQITFVSSVVVFFMLWWVVFFMILPIGITRDPNVIKGCDAGAPVNPNLRIKFFIVTGITVVLFCVYVGLMLWFR
jgi:predicted secreted protein